ncbi:MAG: HIT domain-containing protein [Patescibacteria group bacterium]
MTDRLTPCDFCDLPEVQDRVFLETDLVKALPTHMPVVPGHVLIIPKRHVSGEADLTADEREAISRTVRTLRGALADLFGAEGYNFAWNEGIGQSVPHLHLHMLPRKEGDTGITKYEPRQFLYRPGSREKTPESEARAVAALIRDRLG